MVNITYWTLSLFLSIMCAQKKATITLISAVGNKLEQPREHLVETAFICTVKWSGV